MNRKEFLSSIGMATGGIVVATCFEGCSKNIGSTAPSNVDFTLDLTQLANAVLTTNGGYLYSNGLIVAKTITGNFIAVSAACTHEGTSVNFQPNNNQFYCPNHGATFNTSGAVTKGPANTPLRQYNTSLVGNNLRIYS